MLTYAFPPAGGSGVQRSAKFAKYLPEHGWEPIVWSAGAPSNLPRDDSLLADLPGSLERHEHRWLDPAGFADAACAHTRRVVQMIPGRPGLSNGAVWRVRRLVEAVIKHTLIPDPTVLWALTSVAPLRKMIARRRIDAIYSTYSPPSNHLLAWLLSRATHVPWVADFRDLWTQDFRYPFAEGPRWRRALDRHLEGRFVNEADAVIGVTPQQTELLAERADHPGERFVTITNGYDAADFADLHVRAPTRDAFTLCHVGGFRAACIGPAFFDGLRRFAERLGTNGHRFQFRVVGQMSQTMATRLDTCRVRWISTGYVVHAQAVQEMASADVLLLGIAPGAGAETVMTGKVFEYLASHRPVLAMTPPNSVAGDLIKKCHAGVVVAPEPNAIADTLGALWRAWAAGALPSGCDPARLAAFTRRNLAGRLAGVLEAVRSQGAPSAANVLAHRTVHRNTDLAWKPSANSDRSKRVKAGFRR